MRRCEINPWNVRKTGDVLARDLRGGGVMFRGYLQTRPINRFIAGSVQGISITRERKKIFRGIRSRGLYRSRGKTRGGDKIDLGPRHRAGRDGWFMPLLFRGRALIVRQTRWKHVRRTRNTQRNSSTGEGHATHFYSPPLLFPVADR